MGKSRIAKRSPRHCLDRRLRPERSIPPRLPRQPTHSSHSASASVPRSRRTSWPSSPPMRPNSFGLSQAPNAPRWLVDISVSTSTARRSSRSLFPTVARRSGCESRGFGRVGDPFLIRTDRSHSGRVASRLARSDSASTRLFGGHGATMRCSCEGSTNPPRSACKVAHSGPSSEPIGEPDLMQTTPDHLKTSQANLAGERRSFRPVTSGRDATYKKVRKGLEDPGPLESEPRSARRRFWRRTISIPSLDLAD